MKKIFIFMSVLIFCLFTPFCAFADEYAEYLKEFNTDSIFENAPDEAVEILEELGIDDFDFNNILKLTPEKITNSLKETVKGRFETPVKVCLETVVLVLFSAMVQSMKASIKDEMLSNIFSACSSVIIAVIISVKISSAITLSSATVKMCADFIVGFIPVFILIVATSGSVVTTFSTNALLLGLAQFLNFLSGNLFVPVVNCYLALGIANGIRPELHLTSITDTLKRYITVGISVCATVFVSILSIKTAAASRADALGLRSARFAINSVVPVIGSAISEGLLSIQSYSSLIKSSVGIVGIILIFLIFIPSLLDIVIWKICLSVCLIVSEMFEDRSVSVILKTFQSVLLLILVILILSMVTTIISFGILIATKNQI